MYAGDKSVILGLIKCKYIVLKAEVNLRARTIL